MKGDIIVLEDHHVKVASLIVPQILDQINKKRNRFIITVSGESGSGKSETGKAIQDELERHQIKAVLLGQDDYFHLPPRSNDAKRREDPEWLGPHVEVRMDLLQENIKCAMRGDSEITKPLIDYENNCVEDEKVPLDFVKVLVVEGTYTSLLKHVDIRIFINRNRLDTYEHRKKRNRGNEVNDPFIEQILFTEHKIIAGHRQLADFVITKDYDLIVAN